jgi:hypothetical protein
MNERERIKRWIDHLASQQFYGSFQILFENGHAVHTRQETSRKPADLRVPSDLPTEVHAIEQRK